MINAIGIAFILSKKPEKKKKVYLNDRFALIDIFESKDVYDSDGNPLVELTCKYSIYLDEKYYCKSLDDYTGQIFPFLKEKIGNGLVRNLNYYSSRIDIYDKKPPVKEIRGLMEQVINYTRPN
ncbi:cytoplasmic protein [Bacillus cytotoxicus]|uniref:Cytoplasmic protein n=1 Tax=Bacillus cytotoxicus TaxID=580165 RepID=A0ACC6A914_9BACI|nr:cytoplasmic protein [Bacillus cytotoxicus]HDX9579462.1 cytoplasmic protein [Bacillus pseudomycoides]